MKYESIADNVEKKGVYTMSHERMPSLEMIVQQGLLISSGEDKIIVNWGHLRRLHKKADDKLSFWISDFFLTEKKPWVVFEHSLKISKKDFIDHYDLKFELFLDMKFNEPSHQNWCQNFELIKHYINQGTIEKLVPVVQARTENQLTIECKKRLLANVLTQSHEQYVYAFFESERGLVGVTPEKLFYKKNNHLTTMALAGTESWQMEAGSLLKNPKEIKEHNFVVKSIVDVFKNYGNIKVHPTYEWRLPPLKHLRTDISVDLSVDLDWMSLIKIMHPTPALGCFPRDRWLEFKSLLNKNRRSYGAPIGYSSKEVDQAFVAIRNIYWDKNQIYLSSGCGVVFESVCDKEWQELKLKRNSVVKRLGL